MTAERGMKRLIKNRGKKAGLPPGTLVHIGEKRTDEVRVTTINYSGASFEEKEAKGLDECLDIKDAQTIAWVNVEGIHQIGLVQKVGECFGLHPLVLEDILNTDQRPKIEDYGDYFYIVLKMLYPGNGASEIAIEQVSIILGKNFVITFQEGREGDVFNHVREAIRSDKGRIRKTGPDYLAYSLMDAIIDGYFTILEKLGDEIEALEDELIKNPSPATLQAIHRLKRELIFLRRSVWPLREVAGALERGESMLINAATRMYLRDMYDHTIQVIDAVETFRDMLSGMLDIYLSSISNRLNEVMKVLTIIATIFMPLTLISGIYGMNFRRMPELEWPWGYPLVIAIMVAIALTMVFYFRKRKWM